MARRCNARPGHSQRGAVSLELALAAPIIFIIAIAGIHFGRVFIVSHRLEDATSVATREAAVEPRVDEADIAARIRDRMGGDTSGCDSISVVATVDLGSPDPTSHTLDVVATCAFHQPFGGDGVLGGIGPTTLTARSSAPWRGGAVTEK